MKSVELTTRHLLESKQRRSTGSVQISKGYQKEHHQSVAVNQFFKKRPSSAKKP